MKANVHRADRRDDIYCTDRVGEAYSIAILNTNGYSNRKGMRMKKWRKPYIMGTLLILILMITGVIYAPSIGSYLAQKNTPKENKADNMVYIVSYDETGDKETGASGSSSPDNAAGEQGSSSINGTTGTDGKIPTGAPEDTPIDYANERQVAVAITYSGGGRTHPFVRLTAGGDCSVNDGSCIRYMESGETMELAAAGIENGVDMYISPNDESGRVQLDSVDKSGGNPSYRGTLHIYSTDYGYKIINILPLEQYLYAVVSSEVPESFCMEALKAQAICARGYVLSLLEKGEADDDGADLDDTAVYQVYNNFPETEASIAAVDSTRSEVATYDGEIIETFYFSTSCGTTCSNSEVWGGEARAYLNANIETAVETLATDYDLTNEGNFRSFIDTGGRYDTVEKNEPFFRWRVEYTNSEIGDIINEVLYNVMQGNLGSFYVLDSMGEYQPATQAFTTLGYIVGVTVAERSESGMVQALVIKGTEHTIKVTGQSNIRAVLSPKHVSIVKQDGTDLTGWSNLPSAFFYVDMDENGNVTVKGGGFGHGVGMSQNGSNCLAAIGFTADEIIKHYYNGVEIVKMK